MRKKGWIKTSAKKTSLKVSDVEKSRITEYFQTLIEDFQARIKPPEDTKLNYLADVFSSWYRNYFYINEKWKSEAENRIENERVNKVVRLEYLGGDSFNFSYFRYTGQWHLVATDITLQQCKEMILGNSNFQPMFF